MAGADGTVIIATLIDTDGIRKGTVEIEKELLKTGDSAEKANDSIGGKLASGFKKLGAAMAAAGIVDALVDFGKEAISLGSDLEEVQNVVDVTFTTMSKQVNKFAKDAQRTAGLSETMAKRYVGTFGAMADSFGFTEMEAYEMSTALTQLTGDVASFYNITQDEAATKLKGVFTGETEALKELGVVMTQTALDAYAMANGFDKTTSSMTEQEKVALRYQFVMDQLSAASGDFVRTQDSWANQSRTLALQWESMMATIGTGLIDALSPGMEFLTNKVMPSLQSFADQFAKAMEPTPAEQLNRSLKTFEKTVGSTNETLEAAAQATELNASLASIYAERLKELEAEGIGTADAQREYANAVNQLNQIYPELNLQINEQTGLLNANSRAQLANLDALQKKYFLTALEQQYNDVLTSQANLEAQLYVAEARLNTIQAERSNIMKALSESTGVAADQLVTYYWSIQTSAGAMTDANGEVITLTENEQALYAALFALNTEMGNTQTAIGSAKAAMADNQGAVDDLASAYKKAAGEAGKVWESQKKLSSVANETQEALIKLSEEYAAAQEAAKASLDSQIGMFDELKVSSDKSAADIIKNWESQRAAFENYKANLQKAVEMGLDQALVQQLSDGSTQSMAILNEFVNSTDVSIDDINEAFRKTEEAKEITASAMADVQTEMGSRLAEIEGTVSKGWGKMNSIVRAQILEMQGSIDSLKGKTVYVNVKQRGSTSTLGGGFVANTPVPFSVTNSVPYLASGAVIPPNAPFMAVLGDQRHGTNIEAPLSTIQQAVALAMEDQIASNTAGHEATVAVLREILQTVMGISLGDEVIGAAAERYSRRMAMMKGV